MRAYSGVAFTGTLPVEVLMNLYITMDEYLAMNIEKVEVADAKDFQNVIR